MILDDLPEKITAARFKKATGYPPHDDDLARCNCALVGEIGHFMCGWDYKREMPNFIPSTPKFIDPIQHNLFQKKMAELWNWARNLT